MADTALRCKGVEVDQPTLERGFVVQTSHAGVRPKSNPYLEQAEHTHTYT